MRKVYDVFTEEELHIALDEIFKERSDATVIIQIEQNVELSDDSSDVIPF